MSNITALQLAAICQTAAGKASAAIFAPLLDAGMTTWSINTPERAAMFIAHILVESSEFQVIEDTADTDDYRQRGLLPVAGLSDYIACGKSLGLDLENDPDLLLVEANAVAAACWRWTQQGHNGFADAGATILSARALLPTSYVGLATKEREGYYRIACDVLGAFVVVPPADPSAAAGNTGASTTNGFLRWIRDKLYAISPSNWLVVGGAAAVGSAPTANPIGISAIDLAGLKRAILSDALGQLFTTEQDSAVFTASASSASVLFTVDMTNWRSVLLQITSAGSSCTIIYETCNDQGTWIPTTILAANVASTSSVINTSSSAATQYQIQKRGKYLRARVSVYGSGTVSVAYSLSLSDVNPTMGACVWGPVGEGSAVGTNNPVVVGIEGRAATKTVIANGQVVRPIGTLDGRMVVRPHSIPENEGYYAPPVGGLVNTTTALTIKGATANLRTYITSIQLQSEVLTNATEFVIRDGAGGTVLWRVKIPTTGLDLKQIDFEDPLKSSVNTLIEYATLTASGTGAVYLNAQWYQAP